MLKMHLERAGCRGLKIDALFLSQSTNHGNPVTYSQIATPLLFDLAATAGRVSVAQSDLHIADSLRGSICSR